jgi:hypothetical protein
MNVNNVSETGLGAAHWISQEGRTTSLHKTFRLPKACKS